MLQQHKIPRIINPRPSNRNPPPLPHHDLAGVYFNPGYGTLALCYYPPFKPFEPTRKGCEGAIPEAIQPLLNTSTPVLLAAFPKLSSTHLVLHHQSGNKFAARMILTFPAPFPDAPKNDDDSRPFALLTNVASAEFVFAKHPVEESIHVEGIACWGLWRAGDGVKEPKGEGREGAEVWFDRVA